MQVEKLKAEAANQQAEVQKLHATTVHQMYVDDLDAFLAAYEAWEAEEAANSGLYSDATQAHIVLIAMSLKGLSWWYCKHLAPTQSLALMNSVSAACTRMLQWCCDQTVDVISWCCVAKLSEQQRRALLKGTGQGRAKVNLQGCRT